MCGIVGFTGDTSALPIVLDGLSRLEYRGYDSSGVALMSNTGVWRRRRLGKLAELIGAVGDAPTATCGIGHTRWATHGRPSERNAHPHVDSTGDLALIHNGIIENYLPLRVQLEAEGVEFVSETDTEVLAQLIGRAVREGQPLADAVRSVMRSVDGSFALAVVHKDDPELIVAGRRSSPLVVGVTDKATIIASDIPALLPITRNVIILEDDQIVEVRPGVVDCTDIEGNPIECTIRTVEWDIEAAEKGGFEDFMLKEINEQPQAVRETLRGRIGSDSKLCLDEVRLTDDELRSVDKVFVVGCGTSYHAGLVAKYAIEHWTRLPVEIDIASEFRYRDPVLDAQTLVVGVSQSGETLDTMEACRQAKRWKAKVLAVSNVVDSSMAREADAVLYTRAGPEIGVAATKTHLAQIVAMQVLALYLAQLRGTVYPDEARALLETLHRLPESIDGVMKHADSISEVARKYTPNRDFFFLGRNVGFPVALEGALKLKEISYVRAEGYPAGELKHGPIALVEPGTVVVGVATRSRLWQKMMSNIQEVKARGASVVLVCNEGDDETAQFADDVLWVPRTHELFSPAVDVVALQIFAYAHAKATGKDVDKPRNLAKTVTVE